MVRRGAKRLLSARRSTANVKVSSPMRAGSGISIHSSRGRSRAQGHFAMNRRPVGRSDFVTFRRGPTFVLLKQAVPLGGLAQHAPHDEPPSGSRVCVSAGPFPADG